MKIHQHNAGHMTTVEWLLVALTHGLIRGVPMVAESLHTNTDPESDIG